MLATLGRGLELAGLFVALHQVHGEGVLEKHAPDNTSELDIDLIFWSQIEKVEEHIQCAKLDAAPEVHDVSFAGDVGVLLVAVIAGSDGLTSFVTVVIIIIPSLIRRRLIYSAIVFLFGNFFFGLEVLKLIFDQLSRPIIPFNQLRRKLLQADVSEPINEQLICATLASKGRVLAIKLAVVDCLLQFLRSDLVDERYPLLPRPKAIQRVFQQILIKCLAFDPNIENYEQARREGSQ